MNKKNALRSRRRGEVPLRGAKRNTLCLFLAVFALAALLSLSSCVTSSEVGFVVIDNSNLSPATLTTTPVIDYTDPGIKYEIEAMYLHNFPVFEDSEASGGYAARLVDGSSRAQVSVRFPAGTYECLLMERASDSRHNAFYVFVDETPYRVYAGNPPEGAWELTVRAPVVFQLDTDATVLITIRANSDTTDGSTGMDLDCIQFIKRD